MSIDRNEAYRDLEGAIYPVTPLDPSIIKTDSTRLNRPSRSFRFSLYPDIGEIYQLPGDLEIMRIQDFRTALKALKLPSSLINLPRVRRYCIQGSSVSVKKESIPWLSKESLYNLLDQLEAQHPGFLDMAAEAYQRSVAKQRAAKLS